MPASHRTSAVEMVVGERIAAADVGDFDNFLTARWALFGSMYGKNTYAQMFHEPWPLYR